MSIRKLKEIHDATHPGAKNRPKDKEKEPESPDCGENRPDKPANPAKDAAHKPDNQQTRDTSGGEPSQPQRQPEQ